jgi:Uma2 family endonuclease
MDTSTLLTADELYRLRIPDKRTELVRGRMMVREPAGHRHGYVTARLTGRIVAHVESHALGRVYAAETGFRLARQPDTVRAPDCAFVRAERVPEIVAPAFPDLAPDLVVEVLSPDDRPGEVLAKVADWLTAGSALVWVVDPERRQARIYRADGSESQLDAGGTLSGETTLPGFACPLAELL